jgi:hypothetical protein
MVTTTICAGKVLLKIGGVLGKVEFNDRVNKVILVKIL